MATDYRTGTELSYHILIQRIIYGGVCGGGVCAFRMRLLPMIVSIVDQSRY